jgi:DNA-binding transcriptional MerR regulator
MVENKAKKNQPEALTTGQVSSLVGMDRNALNRWRMRGYVKPEKRRIGSKDFYFYTDHDAHFINYMWQLVKQGYAPRKAYEQLSVLESEPKQPRITEDENFALVVEKVLGAIIRLFTRHAVRHMSPEERVNLLSFLFSRVEDEVNSMPKESKEAFLRAMQYVREGIGPETAEMKFLFTRTDQLRSILSPADPDQAPREPGPAESEK